MVNPQTENGYTPICKTLTIRKDIYDGLRNKIYERDNFSCRYCGIHLNYESVTIDHIIPVCKNGDNSPSNLLTCCWKCNSKKKSMLLINTDMTIIPTSKEVVKCQSRRWITVTLQSQMNY